MKEIHLTVLLVAFALATDSSQEFKVLKELTDGDTRCHTGRITRVPSAYISARDLSSIK